MLNQLLFKNKSLLSDESIRTKVLQEVTVTNPSLKAGVKQNRTPTGLQPQFLLFYRTIVKTNINSTKTNITKTTILK